MASTHRPEVLGGLGDFGGLFALDTGRYRQPVLVAGTDGVGTKALVAEALGRFDTIGIDLVAMCVDDLVCQGAEPLFFLDYISSGAVDPTQMAELVAGVAEGCRQVGAALLGGEMAEHPGVMKPGQFDLVGFAVGVVERSEVLGPSRVRPGDVLIGLASPGPAVQRVHPGPPGAVGAGRLTPRRAGMARGPVTLADELLRPSVIYTPAVRAAIAASAGRCRGSGVHAVAHITGAGFEGNVPRALPRGAAGGARPGDVGGAAHLRGDPPPGPGDRRRDGPGVQPGARHDHDGRPRQRRRRPRGPARQPGSTPRWWAGWTTGPRGVEFTGPEFWPARRRRLTELRRAAT